MQSPSLLPTRWRFPRAILFWPLWVFLSVPAGAAEGETTPGSVVTFFGGVASAALIHEASHAAVAGLTGTRLSWEWGDYNQPIGFTDHARSDRKGMALYSAGLLAQVLGSEILLGTERIDKNHAYVRGMMAWNIVNPILYCLDYWFFHVSNRKDGIHYQGDLQGIEHYSSGGTANVFAASIAAITAYQGYRFIRSQTWAPDWMKGRPDAVGLAPLSSGGLAMSYRLEF